MEHAPPTSSSSPRPAAWPLGVLVLGANLVLAFFFLCVISTMLGERWWIPFVAQGLVLAGELAWGLRLRGGPRDLLGRALVWGFGLSAIVAVLAGLLFLTLAITIGGWLRA